MFNLSANINIIFESIWFGPALVNRGESALQKLRIKTYSQSELSRSFLGTYI